LNLLRDGLETYAPRAAAANGGGKVSSPVSNDFQNDTTARTKPHHWTFGENASVEPRPEDVQIRKKTEHRTGAYR